MKAKGASPETPSLKGTLLSSGVMAFAGLGGAILYPVLPVYADELGISIFWIGLLLSINRFVRVVGNTWVANQIRLLGVKKVMVLSSGMAVVTTSIYGLSFGLFSLLLARLVWGLSYSGLKSATLNIAALYRKAHGFAFGLTQSIKSFGALCAFLVGPILINIYGIKNGFLFIGLFSMVALLLALLLPNHFIKSEKVRVRKTFTPTPINILVFGLSFSVDGLLVVALSSLLTPFASNEAELLLSVSFYLLLSRLFMVVVSLINGLLSLRISPNKLFVTALVLVVLGFGMIASGIIIPGVITVFFSNAAIVSFSPAMAISGQTQNQLQAVSGVSTWWDLGAGCGAFIGLGMLQLFGQQSLFIIVSFVITILFFNFIFQHATTNRQFV